MLGIPTTAIDHIARTTAAKTNKQTPTSIMALANLAASAFLFHRHQCSGLLIQTHLAVLFFHLRSFPDPLEVAEEITKRTKLLVFSMGSGPNCDGQFIFSEDQFRSKQKHKNPIGASGLQKIRPDN